MSDLAASVNDRSGADLVSRSHRLLKLRLFAESEASARRAIALDPSLAMAYNNLGCALQARGDLDGALANYRQALELSPSLRVARRNLAKLLVKLGRREQSWNLWHAEMKAPGGRQWIAGLISRAMLEPDYALAGEYATVFAGLRRGSRHYPAPSAFPSLELPLQPDRRYLSPGKLRHDVEQFEYLIGRAVLGSEFRSVIKRFNRVAKRLVERNPVDRVPLDAEDEAQLGDVYGRLVHVRHTPRLPRALSGEWDAAAVEEAYLANAPGVVVIDNFLSPDALSEVRSFCLESTLWFSNRYAYGRLGAFLHDGFACPLLMQLADELRQAFPRIIGERHPLRQLWGFKNDHYLPFDANTHADFAAVNVNFWVTPTEANLDPASGGMVIYDVDAPLEWDFNTYNGRSEVIRPFLANTSARQLIIPYRQNRAIIFNSDLFHGTNGVNFRPNYECRRINITMLYGDREDDDRRVSTSTMPFSSTWRSAAFTRARRAS